MSWDTKTYDFLPENPGDYTFVVEMEEGAGKVAWEIRRLLIDVNEYRTAQSRMMGAFAGFIVLVVVFAMIMKARTG